MRGGDAVLAFGAFLDRELAGLRRYAMVLTGDPQTAHDVLADALEKAQRRWARIGRMSQPLAYVRRIVTSTYVSHQRRWSVRMIRATRTGTLPEQQIPDPTDAVDDRAELHRLLAALPVRQRAVVVLRYYLGLDNASVATELGMTEGAVRTAHSRALAKLRVAMTPDGDAPGSAAGSRGPGAVIAGAPGAAADRVRRDDTVRGGPGATSTATDRITAQGASSDTASYRSSYHSDSDT